VKIAILSLIISILVAILSVFQFERYQTLAQGTEHNITKVNEKIRPEFATLESKIALLQQEVHALNQKDAESEWKMFEAYHLTELAAERLNLAYDVKGALYSLDKVNSLITSMNDAKNTKLLEQIHHAQETLGAISIPNMEELWAVVGNLSDKVDTLPLRGQRNFETIKTNDTTDTNDNAANTTTSSLRPQRSNPEMQNPVKQNPAEASPAPSTWKSGFDRTLARLKDLVKIQRHDQPISPLLPEEEQLLAKEHLKLILEQLRWAVLHNDILVYQHSLTNAENWINTYFDTSDQKVKNVSLSLKTLSKLNIKPQLPDLHPLLALFPEAGEK
jgi:uroporphyrin-III C-methyltransferase